MRNRLSLRRLKLPVGLLAVGVVAGLSLPAWLNEGLADVYSTLKLSGKRVIVGQIYPGR